MNATDPTKAVVAEWHKARDVIAEFLRERYNLKGVWAQTEAAAIIARLAQANILLHTDENSK